MNVDEFFNEYLKQAGKSPDTKYIESYCFDSTKETAQELLDLVLCGQKRATSSSLYYFKAKNVRIPQIGDLCVITDWEGNPGCVVETKEVTMIPFKDMTYDICKREGEDDNLESWRKGHISFFTWEGNEIGYTFSEDMMVVFEDFEVVYKG